MGPPPLLTLKKKSYHTKKAGIVLGEKEGGFPKIPATPLFQMQIIPKK